MAYSEENIKMLIMKHLRDIADEVQQKFSQDTPAHLTEDTVNEKIATAISKAFTQFVSDADVVIPAQTLSAPVAVKLKSPAGKVEGTVAIPQITRKII